MELPHDVRPAMAFNFWLTLWESEQDRFVDVALDAASALTGLADQYVFGGFTEVTGLDASVETEEHWEGGNNRAPLQFAKHGSHPNLTLRRGVTFSTSLTDWVHQAGRQPGSAPRKDGLILLLERGGLPSEELPAAFGAARSVVAGWWLRSALPKKLKGPHLNAKSNEVAVEELSLTHEGLFRLSPSVLPGIDIIPTALQAAASLVGSAGLAAVERKITSIREGGR